MNRIRTATAVLAVGGLLSLAACSPRPPDCDSAEAEDYIRDWLVTTLTEELTSDFERRGRQNDSAQGQQLRQTLDAYGKDMQFSLELVTTEGYSQQARKYVCTADFAFGTTPGGEQTLRARYAIQATKDSDEPFVVLVPQQQQVLAELGVDFGIYQKNRAAPAPAQ